MRWSLKDLRFALLVIARAGARPLDAPKNLSLFFLYLFFSLCCFCFRQRDTGCRRPRQMGVREAHRALRPVRANWRLRTTGVAMAWPSWLRLLARIYPPVHRADADCAWPASWNHRGCCRIVASETSREIAGSEPHVFVRGLKLAHLRRRSACCYALARQPSLMFFLRSFVFVGGGQARGMRPGSLPEPGPIFPPAAARTAASLHSARGLTKQFLLFFLFLFSSLQGPWPGWQRDREVHFPASLRSPPGPA